MTQQPALSVPCGFTAAGLPVGLQIVGARHADALVLRVGQAYQSATDWHLTHTRTHGRRRSLMSRLITVSLDKRGVSSCTARLLDDAAPAHLRSGVGCAGAGVVGAGVSRQVRPQRDLHPAAGFRAGDPGKENTTVTPIPGDLCWFSFDSDELGNPAYGYENTTGTGTTGAIVDLALFYGRNNLLINGDQGWVPGNVFGAIIEGLEEMAEACQDLWMGGVRGETLTFRRA